MADNDRVILENHRLRMEALSERLLSSYLRRAASSAPGKQKKVFNDPVWGSLTIYPFEIVILDSPLLQRLRRIRQLGVVHWVYPGANHTRLEHSLGTVHLIQKIADAINSPSQADRIPLQMVRVLRIAALCHDMGHGFMSHVSEKALESFEEIEELTLAFVDAHELEKCSLSEINAYFLVKSPSFQRLFDIARTNFPEHAVPTNTLELVANTIIGGVIDKKCPLLQELISGPFDVDKLDYMTRDAIMCGVPIVTDVPRLIEKIAAVEVSEEDLPDRIASRVPAGEVGYTILGVELSGARTLDELMLGRALLYDKVYRHQKVRTIEAMIGAIVEAYSKLLPDTLPELGFKLDDDTLLNLNETALQQQVGRAFTEPEKIYVRTAADLSKRVRDRELFVRCLAFSQVMPRDPYRGDGVQVAGLWLLQTDSSDPLRRRQLVSEIIIELREIVAILGDSVLDDFSDVALDAYVAVSSPDVAPHGGEIARAHLIIDHRTAILFRDDAGESRPWADAYLLTREVGYVFAPEPLVPYVFLAAEKVIRRKYGVRLPASMAAYSKQEEGRIDEVRKTLYERNYYQNAPYDLRPLPQVLKSVQAKHRISAIAKRFKAYQPPVTSSTEEQDKVTFDAQRVYHWLQQFGTDELVEGALSLIEKTRFIERDTVVSAFRAFMGQHADLKGAFLCPLGSSKDSSSHIAYFAQDIAPEYEVKVVTLLEALRSTNHESIIFFDDFVGSGGQAIDILQDLFGAERTRDLGEERNNPLLQHEMEELRARKVYWLFIAGWEAGKQELEQQAEVFGLTGEVASYLQEKDIPVAFPDTGSPPTALQAFCTDVGSSLLASQGQDPAKVEQRARGYGNKANLIVFPYNTPTHTLTCLWAYGKVDDLDWSPLFPRRKKL